MRPCDITKLGACNTQWLQNVNDWTIQFFSPQFWNRSIYNNTVCATYMLLLHCNLYQDSFDQIIFILFLYIMMIWSSCDHLTAWEFSICQWDITTISMRHVRGICISFFLSIHRKAGQSIASFLPLFFPVNFLAVILSLMILQAIHNMVLQVLYNIQYIMY